LAHPPPSGDPIPPPAAAAAAMGLFVSKLLSNDMATLELMIGEIARAIREGQWEVRQHCNTQRYRTTAITAIDRRSRVAIDPHCALTRVIPCPLLVRFDRLSLSI
jgi:hypothetical protein